MRVKRNSKQKLWSPTQKNIAWIVKSEVAIWMLLIRVCPKYLKLTKWTKTVNFKRCEKKLLRWSLVFILKIESLFSEEKMKTNEGIWSVFSSYASSIRFLNLFLAAASGQKTNGGNRDFPNGKISSRREKGGRKILLATCYTSNRKIMYNVGFPYLWLYNDVDLQSANEG